MLPSEKAVLKWKQSSPKKLAGSSLKIRKFLLTIWSYRSMIDRVVNHYIGGGSIGNEN